MLEKLSQEQSPLDDKFPFYCLNSISENVLYKIYIIGLVDDLKYLFHLQYLLKCICSFGNPNKKQWFWF